MNNFSCSLSCTWMTIIDVYFMLLTAYLEMFNETICNSYTMGCLPVSGDNPRVLASGLSYVLQVDTHGIAILYKLHLCRPCT